MTEGAVFWLALTALCIFVQSFYSMMEMACVSFNRIRLQYYVNEGDVRARWLNFLLKNPSRLFGTTLVGVNVALQVGSECSRLFYTAVELPAEIAPLTQVFLVLIFAELAPMFAARRYAEHVAMLGAPVVYASSKLLLPITWSFGIISRLANKLMGSNGDGSNIFITRDELQKVFEQGEEDSTPGGGSMDYTLVANIFALRSKTAGQVMAPLSTVPMLPSSATVGQLRDILASSGEHAYVPVYHRTRRNVVGIAMPRDLLRMPDSQLLVETARPAWFLTRTARILRVLQQFRQNKQSIAVILSDKGSAIGILTLDGIVSEIFGKGEGLAESIIKPFIEKTFPGEMRTEEFNTTFDAQLPAQDGETLFDLMVFSLGHEPESGETCRFGDHELRSETSPRIGAKKISVRTLTR